MSNKVFQSVYFALLLAFVVAMPVTSPIVGFNVVPWLVAALCLYKLVYVPVSVVNHSYIPMSKAQLGVIVSMALVYVAYAYGMLISPHVQGDDWFQKLPFILVPCALLWPSGHGMSERKMLWIKVIYAAACVLSLCMCLVHAYIGEQVHFSFANYYYSPLTKWLRHPAYLSMMYAMAVVWLISVQHGNAASKAVKIVCYVFNAILAAGIVLMGSRAGILAFVLIMAVYFVYECCVNTYAVWRWVRAACVPVICFCITFLLIPHQQNRAVSTKQVVAGEAVQRYHDASPRDARVQAWQASWCIGRQYFPVGVGIENFKKEQKSFYEEHAYWLSAEKELNAHNQYLQMWACMGLIGVSVMAVLLGYGIYIALKYRQVMLLLMLVLVAVNYMFESMLERQDGIIFTCFFYSILCAEVLNNPKE